MKALLLLIVFFSGICCILVDSEEKKVNWTEITKDPLSSIADRNSLKNKAYDDFIDKYDIKRILPRNRPGWNSTNTKVDWSRVTYINKLNEMDNEEKEKRILHGILILPLKIVGAIILVLICGGLCTCARCLCRKKNQQVASNAEETFPALPPNPDTTGTQQYPQQHVSYPMPQMLNPPYGYSPLQQNPHNPVVPYPTASNSIPSCQPAPYSTAPYPTARYPVGSVSSPPALTYQEKEANTQV